MEPPHLVAGTISSGSAPRSGSKPAAVEYSRSNSGDYVQLAILWSQVRISAAAADAKFRSRQFHRKRSFLHFFKRRKSPYSPFFAFFISATFDPPTPTPTPVFFGEKRLETQQKFFYVNLNERNAKVHFSAETKKKLLPRSKQMISN